MLILFGTRTHGRLFGSISSCRVELTISAHVQVTVTEKDRAIQETEREKEGAVQQKERAVWEKDEAVQKLQVYSNHTDIHSTLTRGRDRGWKSHSILTRCAICS